MRAAPTTLISFNSALIRFLLSKDMEMTTAGAPVNDISNIIKMRL